MNLRASTNVLGMGQLGPVFDLGVSLIDAGFTSLFAVIGVLMVAVLAPGEQGSIQRHINRFKIGRLINRVSVSILAVFSGVGAELYYSPRLLEAPRAAGIGVTVGFAAVLVGLAVLAKKRTKRTRKALLTVTAVATVVLVSGCALGNAIGEAAQ
jgi:uncharacterized membrane protein